jgi:hypothetical protein
MTVRILPGQPGIPALSYDLHEARRRAENGGFPTFRFSIELMRKAFFHNLSWANMSRREGARREPRGVLLRIYQMRSN